MHGTTSTDLAQAAGSWVRTTNFLLAIHKAFLVQVSIRRLLRMELTKIKLGPCLKAVDAILQ